MPKIANAIYSRLTPRLALTAIVGGDDLTRPVLKRTQSGVTTTKVRIAVGVILLLLAPFAASVDTRPPIATSNVDLADPPASVDPEHSKQVLEIDTGFEVNGTTLNNTSLGQRSGDNVQMSDQELQAALSYRPAARMFIFGELKLVAEQEERDDATPRVSEEGVERGETWLHFENLLDSRYSIKIGRQNFFEPRRWWWDDDLDAVSVNYLDDRWQAYLGYGEEFGRTSSIEDFIDPTTEDVARWLAHANRRVFPGLTLATFYLRQRDNSTMIPVGGVIETTREDESDADLNWFGLRANGEISLSQERSLSYWADTAIVNGDETLLGFADAGPGLSRVVSRTQRDVRGWAIDLGVMWTLPWRGTPTLTISHAHGSGDKNLTDDTDRSFRQTGLQDSEEEFRTYGELLRPELSNLRVSTAALTFPVYTNTYLTFGYHRFRQVYPAPFLRKARIEADPTGSSKDIGEELSLLAELRKWQNLEIDLAAAIFKSGNAFGVRDGERATSFFFKLAYEF